MVVVTALASALSLTACSATATPPAPSSSSPTVSVTPTETPTASPTPSLAALTGGPVLAVKIDHTLTSYPRVGISSADVIYVEPVEAGLNRLLAIFSTSMPPKVGPVRSARESDVPLLANYGKVAFAFSGTSSYTLSKLRQGAQVNLSWDENHTGYTTDPKRSRPYHVIGLPPALLARAGGSVPPGDAGFRYGPVPSGGTPATRVATNWQHSSMSLVYDAGKGGYTITADGRNEIDALTGAPVAPANIVVQFVQESMSQNRDVNGSPTPVVQVLGSGDVAVLRGGQVWRGTWKRDSAEAPTTFMSSSGEQLTLAQGQTWVLLVPVGQAAPIS